MFRPVSLSLLALLLCAACTKEQDDAGYQPAGITFRSDSGLTYMSDTVGFEDTLHFGAMVAKGSESIDRVYTVLRVNGGTWARQDTFPFTQNPMAVDFQVVTGNTPRTEDWGVEAVEHNGDITRRSLAITVVQ